MKKNISNEEKLEFLEKFNNEEFQNYYKNIDKVLFPIGFVSLKVFTIFSILGSIMASPWLLLGFIPAFVTPAITTYLAETKRKKAIESLTKNITYKDFKEMIENDELTKLQYEQSAKQMQIHHYAKENNSQIVANLDENKKSNSKLSNQPIKISYNLLNEFANTIRCRLLEFSPSTNPDEPNSYHVKLVEGINRFMEFNVTNSHFIGLYNYEDLDLTAEWRNFLESKKELSATSLKNVDDDNVDFEEIKDFIF